MQGKDDMKSLLGTDRKQMVRRIARIEYLTACAVYLTPEERGKEIKAIAKRKIEEALRSKREYRGIIGAILLKIAIALAVALINKWIQDRLFSVDTLAAQYQEGEPGYEN